MSEFKMLSSGTDTWLINVAGTELKYWNLPIEKISLADIMQVKASYLQELTELRAPLALKALAVNEDAFFLPVENFTVLPRGSHPGAFGVKRKHHIHEGVDIYAPAGATVWSMCEGTVVRIAPFTGPSVNQPHWLDTFCVMIQTRYGVLNYGEITPHPGLREGQVVKRGTKLGTVSRVLVNDKGRPLHMLHFERYVNGTTNFVSSWELNEPTPSTLLDPTLLLEYAFNP